MKNILKNSGFESGTLQPGWRLPHGQARLSGGVTAKRFYKGNYSLALAVGDSVEQVFELPVRPASQLIVYLSKERPSGSDRQEEPYALELLVEYFDGTNDVQQLDADELSLSFKAWNKLKLDINLVKLVRKIRFSVISPDEKAATGQPGIYLLVDSVVLPGHQLFSMNDVRWFGAIGDGQSHPLSERFSHLEEAMEEYPGLPLESLEEEIDRVALQSALQSGYPVHIPAGAYLLGKKGLVLQGVRHIYGDGPGSTVLHYWGADAAITVNSSPDSNKDDWSIQRLSVYCQSPDEQERGANGIRIGQLESSAYNPSKGGKIEDVQISFSTSSGLYLLASQNNLFHNLNLTLNQGDGCRVEAFRDTNKNNHFSHCSFRNNGRNGLFADGGAAFSFHACTFKLNRAEGARLLKGKDNLAWSWIFARCHFQSNGLGQQTDPDSQAQLLIDRQSESDGIWQNIELRSCNFMEGGSENWNIIGKHCQLLIWYPEATRLSGEGPTFKRKGYFSDGAIINIWDDGRPEYWKVTGSIRSASLTRTYAGNTEIYLAQDDSWKCAFQLDREGLQSGGDLKVNKIDGGIFLHSANGQPFRISVSNEGELRAEKVKQAMGSESFL